MQDEFLKIPRVFYLGDSTLEVLPDKAKIAWVYVKNKSIVYPISRIKYETDSE